MITRHNYESYFILYMDNELDSGMRRQVEDFVEKNPDLKEELELLSQFKLVPDESVIFEGKETLLRTGAIGSNDMSGFEEWLMLYLDGELNPEEELQIQELINSNPAVKEAWEQLQKTKLQPEKIVFEDKQSLYRHEELRPTRFLPLAWHRVAAAVIFLLLAGSLVVILNNNKQSSTDKAEIVKTTPSPGQDKENTVSPVQESGTKEAVAPGPVEITAPVNNTILARTESIPVNKITSPKEQTPVTNAREEKEELVINENNKPSNQLPQPLNRDAIAFNENPEKNINANTPLTNESVTSISPQPSDIIQTSYDDAELGKASGKKTNLRGFLRKVTRTFEKRTNIAAADDDDRLLVGGLAFKLN